MRSERVTAQEKKTYGHSKAGVELTDEVLQQMAEEAETGLDVTKLRRRPGRPSMGSGPAETLPVRLEPELRKALDDRHELKRPQTSASAYPQTTDLKRFVTPAERRPSG